MGKQFTARIRGVHGSTRSIGLWLLLYITFIGTVILSVPVLAYGSSDGELLDNVKQDLKQYYVEDLPDSLYQKNSIGDIISEIQKTDPYTKYYTAAKYKSVVNAIDNNTSGLGIFLEMVSDGAKVVSMNEFTPERDAGLLVGDVIVKADRHMLVGENKDTALRYIQGSDDGVVSLTVKRGNQALTFSVDRQHTANYAMECQILDDHIGYIKIHSFPEYGDIQFGYLLKSCEKKKVDRYIIDLRYNGGGFLNTAIDMAGYFIGPSTAVIRSSKHTPQYIQKGKYHGFTINKPIIFLVNKETASAAEVLTAAVKDFKKAYIIGTKTYGKGCIQIPLKLLNGNTLLLTGEKFFSPKGNPIDKVGVTPDLEIGEQIDGLGIAELIMDSQKQLDHKAGAIRLSYDNKIIIAQASKARSEDYWQAFQFLFQRAEKNGSISYWDGNYWYAVKNKNANKIENIFYRNYTNVGLFMMDYNKAISLGLPKQANERSLNSKNIEMIDSVTGKRLAFKITLLDDDVTKFHIEPTYALNKGYTYYLVISPSILMVDNTTLGKGYIYKVVTNT